MKTEFFRFFHQRSDVKLNRKVFVFVVCLIISLFSWLQINLSKEYITNILVKVDFVNLPKTRFGITRISDTLLVEAEANGYAFFKYKIMDVVIDFKKLKKDNNSGVFYFLPNNYTKTIGKQLGDNFNVLRAMTDTIQLNPSLR